MVKQSVHMPKDKSLWKILAIAVMALVVTLGGRWYLLNTHDQAGPVGGPFALIDHTGQPRSDKDFLGSYMLIYFGYTYCPDVCPISLQTANDILDILPPDLAKQIVPIMISVDPERDTPERLAEYVANFHPRTVGLTGSIDQILEVSKAYRVIAVKSGTGDTYQMDHSSLFFLIAPDGSYMDRFSSLGEPETIASRIQLLMESKKGQ